MDDTFFKVLHPPQTSICGLKLRPYSNWHRACLYSLQSPLLDYDKEFEPSDLLIAAHVMTTAWPNQPDLTPRLSDVIRRWNLTRNLKHFEASANALVNHMLACSGAPEYWEEGAGSGRILTGPATLSVVTTLVTIGFSSEEAWNMTPGLSNWTIAVYSERNGDERRFFWESDLEEMPPDLTTVDEDTLYEQVIKDLGPKKAKEWRAARIRNKKQGTC